MKECVEQRELVNSLVKIHSGDEHYFSPCVPDYVQLYEPFNGLQPSAPDLAAWRLTGERVNSLTIMR
jgi:hypothetical protein